MATRTLEVSDEQYDVIQGIFTQFGWDIPGSDHQTSVDMVDVGTDTDDLCGVDRDENIETPYVIEQNPEREECPYCYCRPCITSEENRQFWWKEGRGPGSKSKRNSSLRKELYKKFWTMLFHRMVFRDDRYLSKKRLAMDRDPRLRHYVWHRRDIMPDCVLKLVRGWLPNLDGDEYMGHMWE